MAQIKHQPQTLHDHVKELRTRFVRSGVIFVLGGSVGYILRKPLIAYLQKPLHETLYYNSPAGGFNFVMKLCFLIGITLALPVVVYNLISFIRPAFKAHISKKMMRRASVMSICLALAGAAFAFYYVVPMSLHFFQGFKSDGIKPLISANDYLSYVVNCIISFMLIFQIPLIVLFIDRIKPLPPKKLLKYEKFVIVGSLALALVLPFTYDPLSQFLIAIPIILLYNLSLILVVLAHRGRKPAYAQKPIAEAKNEKPLLPEQPAQSLSVECITPIPRPIRAFDIIDRRPMPIRRAQLTLPKQSYRGTRTNFLDLSRVEPETSL